MDNNIYEEIPIIDSSGKTTVIKGKQTWVSDKLKVSKVKELIQEENFSLKKMLDEKKSALSLMDREEEQEIEKIKYNQREIIDPNIDYNATARMIIKDSNMRLQNQGLITRLVLILGSYLRGVRKESEMKVRIMQKTQLGGVGFDEQRADKIVEIASEYFKTKKFVLLDGKIIAEKENIESIKKHGTVLFEEDGKTIEKIDLSSVLNDGNTSEQVSNEHSEIKKEKITKRLLNGAKKLLFLGNGSKKELSETKINENEKITIVPEEEIINDIKEIKEEVKKELPENKVNEDEKINIISEEEVLSDIEETEEKIKKELPKIKINEDEKITIVPEEEIINDIKEVKEEPEMIELKEVINDVKKEKKPFWKRWGKSSKNKKPKEEVVDIKLKELSSIVEDNVIKNLDTALELNSSAILSPVVEKKEEEKKSDELKIIEKEEPKSPIPETKVFGNEKSLNNNFEIKRMLVSPIDELRLSLENFRRLAYDPKERIDKIISKVNLLGEDSFNNKILGIRSWRESEVFDLYIKVGEEGIFSNKDIGTVITEREKNNVKTLTKLEFEVVANINTQLSF